MNLKPLFALHVCCLLLMVTVGTVTAEEDTMTSGGARGVIAGSALERCRNQTSTGQSCTHGCPGQVAANQIAAINDHPGTEDTSSIASYIDNVFFNYHHYAVDYQVGSASGCGGCGANAGAGSSLPELMMQRRHRYRDVSWGGSFGPGVFLDTYDTRLTMYQKDGSNRIELFVPERSAAIRLVNDSADASTTGVFKDLRNNLYRDARMYDAGGNLTSSLSAGRKVVFTDYVGKKMEFEMIDLSGASGDNVATYGGRFVSSADRNGYGYQLTYHFNDPSSAAVTQSPERQWQIATIRDAYDREASIAYHPQQEMGSWVISQITPPNGNPISYEYSGGRISRVVHPDGTESTITFGTDSVSQTATVTFRDVSATGTNRNKAIGS